MLYAMKGNRQVKIDDTEKANYESKGFEVFKEEEGKLVALTKKPDSKADAKLIKALEKEVSDLKKKIAELDTK